MERLRRSLVLRCCPSCAIEALCQIRTGLTVTKASPSPSLQPRSKLIIIESFSTLCYVRFDLSEAAETLTPRRKLFGPMGLYYSLSFEVIISFGSTEFTAQVAWKVNVSRWFSFWGFLKSHCDFVRALRQSESCSGDFWFPFSSV